MEVARVVFISIPSDEARKFGRQLVEKRLAACVNIVPQIHSFYWENDEVQSDDESLIIVKTIQQKIDALVDFVKLEHPYELPEVITLPIAEGLPDYINWIIEEMGK